MAQSQQQIKELLGSGLTPEIVASAVGCDQSYISQLLSDENFAGEVAALRTVALANTTKRDGAINTAEDKLLDKLHEVIDSGAIYKPTDVLRAFQVVNNAHRRGQPVHAAGGVVNNIIQLVLPTHVIRKFTTSRANEVIEVEGQTMVTMPAHTLLQRLVTEGGTNGKSYAEAIKFLPSGSAKTIEHEEGREVDLIDTL